MCEYEVILVFVKKPYLQNLLPNQSSHAATKLRESYNDKLYVTN